MKKAMTIILGFCLFGQVWAADSGWFKTGMKPNSPCGPKVDAFLHAAERASGVTLEPFRNRHDSKDVGVVKKEDGGVEYSFFPKNSSAKGSPSVFVKSAMVSGVGPRLLVWNTMTNGNFDQTLPDKSIAHVAIEGKSIALDPNTDDCSASFVSETLTFSSNQKKQVFVSTNYAVCNNQVLMSQPVTCAANMKGCAQFNRSIQKERAKLCRQYQSDFLASRNKTPATGAAVATSIPRAGNAKAQRLFKPDKDSD